MKNHLSKIFLGLAIMAIASPVLGQAVGGGMNTITQLQTYLLKVSSGDTTPGYLFSKLVAGSGVTLTKNSAGANETITIASTGGGSGATTTINGASGPTFTFVTGTSGSDFNIATTSGTVTFNIPTSSASNRGLLSSSDWSTFNSKLSAAITSLNGLTGSVQTFASSSAGTDFGIISSGTTHTFQMPSASASNRGLLTSTDWTTFNSKLGIASSTPSVGSAGYLQFASSTIGYFNATSSLLWDNTNGRLGIGTSSPSTKLDVWGNLNVATGTVPTLLTNTATRDVKVGEFLSSSVATDVKFQFRSDNEVLLMNAAGSAFKNLSLGNITGYGSINYNVFWGQGNCGGPAFSWTADSDTGLCNPAANTIGFTTGASEKMRLDSTGNLGIGTTTPIGLLSIASTTLAGSSPLINIASSSPVFSINSDGSARFCNSAGTLGQVLQSKGSTACPQWVATSTLGFPAAGGSGTVTSVDMTTPTGLSVSGNPVTTSGTLALSLTAGYVIPLTASTTEWSSAYASTTALTPAYLRGLFSNTATGLTYSNTTGATSLTAGYNIPLTASTTNWNSFWDTPSTRITAGTGLSWAGNTLNASIPSFATTSINNFATTTFLFSTGTSGSDFNIATSTTAVTFNCPTASGSVRGCLSSGDWTTFNGKLGAAITSLNGLTGATQTFASSTTGTVPSITSSGTTHTFNWPTASSVNTGFLSNTDWTTFNNKAPTASPTFTGNITFPGSGIWNSSGNVGIGSSTPVAKLSVGSGGSILVAENTLATSTSMTVDWLAGNSQLIRTGTAATAITFSNYVAGGQLVLTICNPPAATAGAVTFSPGIYWSGGTAPTQTTTANKCDLWSFKATNGTSTLIIVGSASTNF